MKQESAQTRVETKVASNEGANVVCANTVREYESNDEFLKELNDVFREDYGIEMSQEELQESGRNLTALLTHFL
jgi:hypothetical protein